MPRSMVYSKPPRGIDTHQVIFIGAPPSRAVKCQPARPPHVVEIMVKHGTASENPSRVTCYDCQYPAQSKDN